MQARHSIITQAQHNTLSRISVPRYGPTKTVGLVRCFADFVHGKSCALCKGPCQEQAGIQYYDLLGWDLCCSLCWENMCIDYHTWLNDRDNTVLNFCNYIVDANL